LKDDLHGGSRTRNRTKRKKTNLILNSLIGLVLLLIIIVSAIIFMGNDKKTAPANEKKVETTTSAKPSKAKSDVKKSSEVSSTAPDESKKAVADGEIGEEAKNDETETPPVITEGGSGPNVKKTIENPSWKPVGTSQTGEHAAVYDDSSVDWQEMLKALSYGTGIDQGNMTVWYLQSNNGNPNQAIGTVSTKDKQTTYRVYIDWVDGQGWKPVTVEELIENDKGH
jgi:cytoskeletal protein RodZ